MKALRLASQLWVEHEAREAALGLTKHRGGGQLIAEQGHAPRPIPPGPELDVPLLPLALALNLSLFLC